MQTLAQRPARASRTALRPQAALSFKLPLPFLSNNAGGGAAQKREEAKAKLLEAIKPLARGAAASEEDRAQVDTLASALERLNPTPKTLCPALSGKWRLLYTTSASILGTSRPALFRPSGPIYQTIDVEKLRARNNETTPFFNSVTADLTPVSSSQVNVQFDTFYIFGLIPIKAPPTASGSLRVTYLDDTLRVSRGDKGNLFVLEMADSSVRL